MSGPIAKIRPFFRISTKHHKITVNLAAHDILGKPPYMEFYWNEENKLLFIAPLWRYKTGSLEIPSWVFKSRKDEISVSLDSFLSFLMKKLGWQKGPVYKVFGELLPEYNMIGFHMADPIIIKKC